MEKPVLQKSVKYQILFKLLENYNKVEESNAIKNKLYN